MRQKSENFAVFECLVHSLFFAVCCISGYLHDYQTSRRNGQNPSFSYIQLQGNHLKLSHNPPNPAGLLVFGCEILRACRFI